MLQQFYPSVQHDYRFELHKDMNFSAAHFVPHLGAGACAKVHGHTYFVDIQIAGDELDEMGMLVNFSDLKKIVHGQYDHTLLNEHQEFTDDFGDHPEFFPTTEVVAEAIYRKIAGHLA